MFSKRNLIAATLLALSTALLAYLLYVWFIVQYPRSSMVMPAAIMDVDRGFKFPPDFPPDPGVAGRDTLEGMDADHDGVRDDIQRWIHAFLPQHPKKRMALRQMARYYQAALRANYDHQARLASRAEVNRAVQCVSETFDDQFRGYMEDRYLKAKVLNTYGRTVRYLENTNKLTTAEISGEFPLLEKPCDDL